MDLTNARLEMGNPPRRELAPFDADAMADTGAMQRVRKNLASPG